MTGSVLLTVRSFSRACMSLRVPGWWKAVGRVKGGGIGGLGGGWLEHLRRWLSGRWAGSPAGSAHRPGPPGAP
eukprot:scaffold1371_cov55-Phaeocystis_antarctica.AAC.7